MSILTRMGLTTRRGIFREYAPADYPWPLRILFFVGRSLKRICLVLGALVLLGGVSSCGVGMYVAQTARPQPISDHSVLVVRLLPDFNQNSGYSWLEHPLAPPPPSFEETVTLLARAINDPKIKAIVFSLRGANLDLPQVQEFRKLITAARAAKKPTYIYAPSYSGLADYYLAAAFDHIWMQPVGTLALDGLGGAQPFFKGLLDQLGIRANFIQRHEYKSVMENMMRADMSPANRQMIDRLLTDLSDQIITDLARDIGAAEGR